MPRRRRYKRYSRVVKPVKYSSETTVTRGQFTQQHLGGTIDLVPPLNAQGVRKAKNFRFQFLCSTNIPVAFVLVYVPEGTQPQPLNMNSIPNTASLYEPNQNVILQGYSYPGQTIFRTRLARNLNAGDKITLVYRIFDAPDGARPFVVSLNYAISL